MEADAFDLSEAKPEWEPTRRPSGWSEASAHHVPTKDQQTALFRAFDTPEVKIRLM
jgi:hypothetical protein